MKIKKPKANLYMLIKIEVDDDNFPNDDEIEVGWNLNKLDAIKKYGITPHHRTTFGICKKYKHFNSMFKII